ncbi:unnamed protein product [Gongylonema pulchrum]|uniref:WD_REPEATS_REGION domain-containing protein n=1 Tax=Gongylonema pulchrum TaxID=637853 RepID=A0A183EW72_9BILA|nr:unnamed protein product [Gongylonema pulchrum]
MGNSYTHLATQDPSDLVSETDSSLLQRWAARLTSTDRASYVKMPRSASNINEKYPTVRAAVHSDAIGALAPVRPGMILSGGRDKLIALNNTDTGECVLRWYGHEKEVTKVTPLFYSFIPYKKSSLAK